MAVTLRVEETRLNRPYACQEFEGPTRQVAIAGYLQENDPHRFDPNALISLLSIHDDLRIGGPTWDVRFTQTFSFE